MKMSHKFKIRFLLLTLPALILTTIPTAWSAELRVPSEYTTIQGAIDASANDDIVTVSPGRYYENLNFKGKAITLTSEDPTDSGTVAATIIDANDIDIGVAFWTSEESDSVLTGFTITNGTNPYGYGGGIYCSSASPTISYCVIENNSVDNLGGGIYLDSSDAIFEYCTIRNNSADHGGGVGIYYEYPTFRFCTFENNTGRTGQAGGIFYSGEGELTLSDCTFTGNTAQQGGGINIWRGTALIQRCLIQNNSATSSGGGIHNFESETTIDHCTLRENSTNNGGAIYLQKSESEIHNCLLAGNEASNGGGIYTEQSDAVIETCTVVGNRATLFGGGGYLNFTSNIELRNNIFWINAAASQGDQIALGPSGNTYTSVSYCDVQGGQMQVNDLDAGTNTLDWGDGNLDASPNFNAYGYWDPNGTVADWTDDFWVEGNYRLAIDSLCIDAGDPAYVAEPDETDLADRDRVINGIVDMGAYESGYRDIHLTKMTCKAGKTRDAETDSFSFQGTFVDADADDFTSAEKLTVWVGNYFEDMPLDDFKQKGKKSKYDYKGGKEGITSVKLDFVKKSFSISAKNVDLSGLAAPISVVIEFGDHVGLGLAQDEGENDVINGKKSLPMQLLSGNTDGLRVDKVVCKQGKTNNVGNLVVSGSIASADDIDLRVASLLLHWGTSDHPVGLDEFERKGKTKFQYKKRPDGLDPANIVISIDLVKCTFQVVAKNTNWPWVDAPLTFGLEFGSFNETEEVTF